MRRVLTALIALAVVALLPAVATTGANAALNPPPEPLGQPSITGTAQVGHTLTAHSAEWPLAGESTFTWTVRFDPSSSAGETYLIPAKAFEAQSLTLTETFTSPGHEVATATTTLTSILKGAAAHATDPTAIGGIVAVGQELTAVRALWPIYGQSTYTWSVGGIEVGTGPSYVVTPADLGKPLTLTELLTPSYYEPSTSSTVSTVRAGLPQTPTARPRIDGTVRVGSTLTVTPGTWPVAGTSSFVWAADGKTIGTGPSFEVPPTAAHQMLTLTEIHNSAGYDPSPAAVHLGFVERVPVTLSLTVRKVKGGKTATVTAVSADTRLPLPNALTVTYAGKMLATSALKDGKLAVKLPKKPQGRYWLTVSYTGTAAFAKARTAVLVSVR